MEKGKMYPHKRYRKSIKILLKALSPINEKKKTASKFDKK
jgi:hypothetical protein